MADINNQRPNYRYKQMDDLLLVIEEAQNVFNDVMTQFQNSQLKQEQQLAMDIENESIVENSCIKMDANSTQNQQEYHFFDSIPENVYNEALDTKIANIKMNSVSTRRKDELFKRQKREQEQKIIIRRKELEQKYPFNSVDLKIQGEFLIKKKDINERFAFNLEDLQKLRPETDLNDTIISTYLRLLHTCILPEDISNKTFIYSSFFMGKLLGDQLGDELFPQKQVESTIDKTRAKVTEAYSSLKRWTKKIDIFEKEYLVIPINAYKHWNCMIVVFPNTILTQSGQCKIIYLDSMCEKRVIFPQAIKRYLELQLEQRKGIKISLKNTIPTFQLLVPRQTNTHDCGLYTLCYIEHLLKNHEIMDQNLELIRNREQLRLFPRSLIFTMRESLRLLFKNLLIQQDKEEVLQEYVKSRLEIERQATEADYDEINEREFKKYYRLNSHLLEDKKKKQSEVEYQCKVKFYLDCEVNHYEKDIIPQ